MTLNDFQATTERTAPLKRGDLNRLTIFGLGVAGEAGEVADLLKKHIGHGHYLDVAKLTRELGDVLWYVAALAATVGVDLEDVAQANIEKLRARYPNGFETARSVKRAVGDT
jgi:NTP pyrophosphatase (non-canonical NTP hydrolase)